MASLEGFAKRIRLLARRLEVNADLTVIATAIAINQTVVVATPVDTGRARGNWRAAIGGPDTRVTDNEDKSGGSTISRNNGIISRYRGGSAVFLSNNLAYIVKLNQGSSAQAPAMFVEQAVATAQRAVRSRRIVT